MIYIHIPFCRSFCTYCDFYSEIAKSCQQHRTIEGFARALEKEISQASIVQDSSSAAKGGPRTLYIGGGTPSVLPLDIFDRIVSSLRANSFIPAGGWDEFTVEVNPEDIVEKGESYVEGLMNLGVNRISMGVQSFDDDILKWMNRRHDAHHAVRAYSILENAGMTNISIDLIFGLPQLTMQTWSQTLDKALSISSKGILPSHISSYQLSIEPGSALFRMLEKGVFSEADEELCSRQYDLLCERLLRAGYNHYEISNFAIPGKQAKHNSAYWDKVPYLGLGPGAHSYLVSPGETQVQASQKIRRWNLPDLSSYIQAGGPTGDFSKIRGQEILKPEEDCEERIMLALRTSQGLPESFLRLDLERSSVVDRLLEEGALESIPHALEPRLRIPESRFFVSDDILSELI